MLVDQSPLSPSFDSFPTPAPTLARTSSVESSPSLESSSTLWSGPSDDLHHSLDREDGDHDAQPAVAMGDAENKGCNVTRCTRGPNRRHPGTGYDELMQSTLATHPHPSSQRPMELRSSTASSSLGPIPNADSWAGFDVTGLNLPPDAMKIIAQCRASGRSPTSFNAPSAPHPSPRRTAKSLAMAKRPTVRPHSLQSRLKSGGVSAYARKGGVPIAKPVPQPSHAGQYLSPLIKARARRSALRKRSKDGATAMPIVIDEPANFITPASSLTNHMQSTSFPATQPDSAVTPKPHSKVTLTLSINSAGPAPTEFWIDHAESPSSLERAQEIAQLPGLRGMPISLIQQILPRLEETERHWHSNLWAPGDAGSSGSSGGSSSQSAGYENPHTPVMQASTMEVPELLPVCIPEPSPPVESPYEPELEQQPPTLLLTEESEAVNQNACSSISNPVHDQNTEEPSVALMDILDLIDVGPPTEFARSADMDVAGMGNIVANFQDSGWEGFFDFDWFNQE
ncbi:hypothetical protein BJV74DRAFT_950409 [Russula compacta]|nr:hypothetical protein BJV74DRAFT_950409 [Russula compacta]